jgi:hypothetical protein
VGQPPTQNGVVLLKAYQIEDIFACDVARRNSVAREGARTLACRSAMW